MTTDELLQRWSDGSITADELRELTAKLAEPEHQSALLDDWLLESSLPDRLPGASVASLPEALRTTRLLSASEPPQTRKWSGWLSWRPLAAAAAGLVFGMFCTSVVFAYAGPWAKTGFQRSIPLFTESFEDAGMKPKSGFPGQANEWFGDVSPTVGAVAGVRSAEGKSIARLPPAKDRKLSYAYRIVDLAESPLPAGAAARQVEVTAAFLGSGAKVADRFQIRLAAFAEAPGEIRPIWNNEAILFDRVLQHVGRNEIIEPGSREWHTVKATMEIPAGTRSLVISLGAAMPEDSAPKTEHFLDDVHARLLITEATP